MKCMFCTEAGEQRSRLQAAASLDSRTAAEQHQTETAELRRLLGCARDDVALLQKQLSDAGDRQAALVVEIRRMAQQLSCGQMELEASRAIASAQRETIHVREAEIARLEARLGVVQRSALQDGSITAAGTESTLADGELTTRYATSCLPPPAKVSSVGIERCEAGLTGADIVLPTGDDGDHIVSDHPDSLLAIWKQLQLNDSIHQSAGTSDQRSTANPPGCASTRLGSALEEKARVQSRVKALIGYREPAKRSSAATKPRMSVRPQPLSHSKTSTTLTSTSMKQPRRASSSDLANASQLSTAVSRYTSSSLDRIATQ